MTSPSGGCLEFVIQKHQARALHYDFRLEVGGVMPSWSIPKGPSLDSKVKRLALPTPDHPMEYRHFEGRIPRGGYGAGAVMIWDNGTYNPEAEAERGVWKEAVDRDIADRIATEGLKAGNLKFTLYGRKLRGSFALVRTSGYHARISWLLIKHRDEFSEEGYDSKNYDFSAVSGRSLEEIATEVP